MREKPKNSPTIVLAKLWMRILGRMEPFAFCSLIEPKTKAMRLVKAKIALAFKSPISWINISAWMSPNNRDWTRLAPRNPSFPCNLIAIHLCHKHFLFVDSRFFLKIAADMLKGIDDLTRIFRKVQGFVNVGLSLIQTNLIILEIVPDF